MCCICTRSRAKEGDGNEEIRKKKVEDRTEEL